MTKHTILFLAANPLGTDRLNRVTVDEEAQAIREALHGRHEEPFELVTRWAVQPVDLLRELRELSPAVIHFSDHGRAPLATAAVDQTLGAAGSSVQLVVLNACYTEVQAETLLAYVPCVVGVGGGIRDDAARRFAIALYGGLGAGKSVATAYRLGCAAIDLDSLPVGDRPQLKVRAGIDAGMLILTEPLDMSPAAGELRDVGIAEDSTGLLDGPGPT